MVGMSNSASFKKAIPTFVRATSNSFTTGSFTDSWLRHACASVNQFLQDDMAAPDIFVSNSCNGRLVVQKLKKTLNCGK